MPSKDPEVARRASKKYSVKYPDKIIARNRLTNARSRFARAIVREERLSKQRTQEERERRDQAKICTGCHKLKSFDDFRNDKYRPHGKTTRCRTCLSTGQKERYPTRAEKARTATAQWRINNLEKRQAYEDAHREENNQKRRERYASNPEQELTVNAAWYEAHKEERKLTMATWETKNRLKRKAQRAARYLANPEKMRARRKAWADAHPGYGAVKWQRRASRQNGAAIVDLSPEQWEEIKAAFNWRCAYCPDDCKECRTKTHDLHQEHIDPVIYGGNYTLHNIVPSCQVCNSRKGTGPPLKPVQPLLLTIAPSHVPKKRHGL